MRENLIEFNNFNITDKNIQFNLNDKDIEKFSTFFLNRNNNDINLYLNDYNSFELDFKTSNNKVDIYLSKYGIINLRTAAVEQSIEIVRRRIDEVGTKEPSILKRGSNPAACHVEPEVNSFLSTNTTSDHPFLAKW